MALELPPELEQRVTALAQANQQEPAALLAEFVERCLEDVALEREIAEGDAAIERGEGIPHDEAMRWLAGQIEQVAPRSR